MALHGGEKGARGYKARVTGHMGAGGVKKNLNIALKTFSLRFLGIFYLLQIFHLWPILTRQDEH